ncbi:MAG: sodium ion-translocating decarboxylase subunit beta, partial [Victivallaceae bacterium]
MSFFKNILAGLFVAMCLLSGGMLAAEEAASLPDVNGAQESFSIEVDGAIPLDELFAIRTNAKGESELVYIWKKDAIINSLSVASGKHVMPGNEMFVLTVEGRSKAKVKMAKASNIVTVGQTKDGKNFMPARTVSAGDVIVTFKDVAVMHDSGNELSKEKKQTLGSWSEIFQGLWTSTGIYDLLRQTGENFSKTWHLGLGRVIMILVAMLLLYLAIVKQYEPLLLLPIGFGAILANIPLAG